MKPARVLLFALLGSLALAASQEPAYDLLWKPKKDEVLNYQLELGIEVEEFKFDYNTDIEMKVLNVEENGDYELQTTTRNTRIRYKSNEDDEELTPKEPEPTVEKYNAKGERITQPEAKEGEEEDDPVSKILEQVTDFAAPEQPVKKGDRWTKELKDEGSKLDYEVIGAEGSGDDELVRVDYTYAQTEGSDPVKATGTYRLRRSDFSMMDFSADVENFKMDREAPPGKAKLSLKRQ